MKSKLIIYDIKSSVANEVEVPDDFDSVDFVAGDMVSYIKKDSDDEYLSCFCYE